MKPTAALGQQQLFLQNHADTEHFAPFLTLAKRLQKPFFLSWRRNVWFIKVPFASMMIVVTASTRLYFLPSCSKCSSRKFSCSQTRRKSCNLEFRVNWRCRIYRDMADILRSPQVCEKLSLASLDLLKGKEVLEKLLVIQLVSKDFSTGNEATATFLDN